MKLTELYHQYPGLAEFIAGAGLFADANIRASVISKGLSNFNYLLSAPSAAVEAPETESATLISQAYSPMAWVLRVNREVAALGCGRVREVTAWRAAADRQLAPELMAVSADHRFYLSRYVDQRPIAKPPINQNVRNGHALDLHPQASAGEMIALPAMISGLAVTEALQQTAPAGATPRAKALLTLMLGLAGQDVPDNLMTASRQWHSYRQSLLKLADSSSVACSGLSLTVSEALPKLVMQLVGRSCEFESWLQMMEGGLPNAALQFCHRDLNPENLLWDGQKLLAIDFEYSCAAYPFSELATVLASHQLTAGEQSWLSREYLAARLPEAPSADWDNAVVASVNVYWLFSCCWALLQAAETHKTDYLDWYHHFYSLLSAGVSST